MPDEYLDELQAHDRSVMWRSRILSADLPPLLVAAVSGEVVGFAAFGKERSTEPTERGELYAINLDPAQWRRGIGRLLLRHATEALSAIGYLEAILWVVPSNQRARCLYESEGWTADGVSTTAEILGVAIDEMRYRKPLIA